MKRPQLVSQGSLTRMLQAANEAWGRCDFTQCFELQERASRFAPANCDILLRLGHWYLLRCEYAAAERAFEKAVRVAPRKAEILRTVADCCQDSPKPEMAERYLRQAIEQAGATPGTCAKLAELYERLRRLPEAAQFVEQALQSDSIYPPALLVRARLERTAGQLEAAEQTARSFITKSNSDTWTHARAWYELGNILDRQGRYDDAMSAFLEAKILLRPQADRPLAQLKALRARLKVMESNVSSEMLKRWFDNSPLLEPRHRLAVLCGHARSGTTLLEQVLDAHPDIVSAEEIPAFVDDAYITLRHDLPADTYMLPALETATNQRLLEARSAYIRIMERFLGSPIAGRVLMDKNPDLTFMIPAFIRIFPETRFLIALRDPRDVVLSCFITTATFLSLEDTVDDYVAAMSVWRKLASLMPTPWLEVRYENMVQDLESIARQALDFLGVPWDANVLRFNEHARKKTVLSPTYADVTQPVYKRAKGRWRNYQKYLEPYLAKLEPFVKAFGYE